MVQDGIPLQLQDYSLVYEAEPMSRTSCTGERTGIKHVTRNTPDISEWLDFTLYDWVRTWDNRKQIGGESLASKVARSGPQCRK
jgi:hypothetical protein